MKLLLSLVLLIFLNTKACTQVIHKGKYDVKINYVKQVEILPAKSLEKKIKELEDSVHIFIEEGFSKDKITLTTNSSSEMSYDVTTDESTGLAKYINLGEKKNIKSVTIRVNRGDLAFIEMKEGRNKIRVYMKDQTLTIEFLNNFPMYQ